MDIFFPFIYKQKDLEPEPLYLELYPPPPKKEEEAVETDSGIIIIEL